MGRATKVVCKGVVSRYSEAVEKLRNPGDYVLVVRGLPRTIIMVCPDGCGENLTVNIDRRAGKAWRIYQTGSKLTVYPSVWRDTGCRAHFVIWQDHIFWDDGSSAAHVDEELIASVLANLPSERYVSFAAIADALNLIPWDVLWACRELVYRGQAIAGEHNTFRKRGVQESPSSTGRIDFRA